ncbi:MAG: hypothetical protein ACE5D7_03530 [Fidelibacterota bacterium]
MKYCPPSISGSANGISICLRALLAIVIFFPVFPYAMEKNAGRIYTVGDTIPESIQLQLTSNYNFPADWKVGICLFSKENQLYSDRIVEELSELYSDYIKDSVPVWEIVSTNFVDNSDADDPNNMSWKRIDDIAHSLYDQFGVRVFPTIFVVSGSWEILSYLPGYSPSSIKKLRESLVKIIPESIPSVNFDDRISENKTGLRLENFARKLYRNNQIELALRQLNTVDSLTVDGLIILGMIHIRMKNYSDAQEIFVSLGSEPKAYNYCQLGMGMIAYESGYPDSALIHFQNAQLHFNPYLIHYWIGKCQLSLGNEDDALWEFQKGFDQLLNDSDRIPIP